LIVVPVVLCLLAAPAFADDASIWSAYTAGDAQLAKVNWDALRGCNAVRKTGWREFSPLVRAERRRGRAIHRAALALRAEQPSSAVGADGRNLGLKGLSAFGRMSRAFVAAFKHADRGEVRLAKAYRAQASRWARRYIPLNGRAHQVFRDAGYTAPPPPRRPHIHMCILRLSGS
jgi:hypothetical protein